jgi:hypothetical protein
MDISQCGNYNKIYKSELWASLPLRSCLSLSQNNLVIAKLEVQRRKWLFKPEIMISSSRFGRRGDITFPSTPILSASSHPPLQHISSASTPNLPGHREVPAKIDLTKKLIGAIRAFLKGKQKKARSTGTMSAPVLSPPLLLTPQGVLTTTAASAFSFERGNMIVEDGLEASKAFKEAVTAAEFEVRAVKSLTIVMNANKWSEAIDASLTPAVEAFTNGHNLTTLRIWIKGNTLFTQRSFVLSRGAIELAGMMAHSAISAYHPYWTKLCEEKESRRDMRDYSPMKKAAKHSRQVVKVLLEKLRNVPNVYIAGVMPTDLREAITKACQSPSTKIKTDEEFQPTPFIHSSLAMKLNSSHDHDYDTILPMLSELPKVTFTTNSVNKSWGNYVLDINNELPAQGVDEEIVRIAVAQSDGECQFGWKVFFVNGEWKVMRENEF